MITKSISEEQRVLILKIQELMSTIFNTYPTQHHNCQPLRDMYAYIGGKLSTNYTEADKLPLNIIRKWYLDNVNFNQSGVYYPGHQMNNAKITELKNPPQIY